MPYRQVGNRVYVLKDGKWTLLKKHPTEKKARAHAAALRIQVEAKE